MLTLRLVAPLKARGPLQLYYGNPALAAATGVIIIYLSIYLYSSNTNNLNAIEHAAGQDSETKSTEHCPKYKQSTVI